MIYRVVEDMFNDNIIYDKRIEKIETIEEYNHNLLADKAFSIRF